MASKTCKTLLTAVYKKYGDEIGETEKDFLDEFKDLIKELSKKESKAKKVKDPNKPKRPLNTYMRFLRDHRADLKAEVEADDDFAEASGREKNGEVSKRCSELWKNASKEVKDKYQKEYDEEKNKMASKSDKSDDDSSDTEKSKDSDETGSDSETEKKPKKRGGRKKKE